MNRRIPAQALPSWESAVEMSNLLNRFGRDEQSRLEALLAESDHFFEPLSDPLTCDLGLHSWLMPQREESYSMWLHWCLQQLRHVETVKDALCLSASHEVGIGAVQVDREVPVSYQGDSGSGRLDIRIKQGPKVICVVEVKTKSYSQDDLEKHRFYSNSPDINPATEKIFLAIECGEFDLGGFTFLPWSEFCIRLRSLVPDVSKTNGKLVAALMLAFVGAIEQNLLGFVGANANDFGAIPATVHHLTRFKEYRENQ